MKDYSYLTQICNGNRFFFKCEIVIWQENLCANKTFFKKCHFRSYITVCSKKLCILKFIFSNNWNIVSFDSIADLFLAKTIDYIVLIFDFLHFNKFLNTSLKRRCREMRIILQTGFHTIACPLLYLSKSCQNFVNGFSAQKKLGLINV